MPEARGCRTGSPLRPLPPRRRRPRRARHPTPPLHRRPPVRNSSDGVAEQRAYDAALDLFKRGDYQGAIGGFGAFVKSVSAQSARVVGAVLDRQRAVRASRLSRVDRHAAAVAEGIPGQQQGAGRAAQHRIRAGRHGRQRGRAAHARGVDRQVSEVRSASTARRGSAARRALTPAIDGRPFRGARVRVAARARPARPAVAGHARPVPDLAVGDHAAADAGRDGAAVLSSASSTNSRRSSSSPPRRSGACSSCGADSATTGARTICTRRAQRWSREHGGRFPRGCGDARDAARHRPLDGRGDRGVRRRRARRHPRRQRQARARAASRRRRVAGRAARAGGIVLAQTLLPYARVARRRCTSRAKRHRRVHAGDDGHRRDDLHARAAALRCMSGARRLRGAAGRADRCRLPSPRPRKVLPQRAVTVLLLERDGRSAARAAPAGRHLGRPVEPARKRRSKPTLRTYVAARFDAAVGRGRRFAAADARLHAFRPDDAPGQRVRITRWPSRARMPGVEWFARDAALASALPAPIRNLLRALAFDSRSADS